MSMLLERSASFDADGLLVEDLHVGLIVTVSDTPRMSVRMAGAGVDAIGIGHLDHAPRTLRIGPVGSFDRAMDSVAVVVGVPCGSAIELRRVSGEARIEDVRGPLHLDLGDAVHVRAVRPTDFDVAVAGQSRVEICGLDADHADIRVGGQARILVDGHAGVFAAEARGLGNVCFRGDADHADLSVDDTATISVMRVRRTLRRECLAGGRIAVAFPPPLDLVRGLDAPRERGEPAWASPSHR